MTPADDATVVVMDVDARIPAATQRPLTTVGLHSDSFASLRTFYVRSFPMLHVAEL